MFAGHDETSGEAGVTLHGDRVDHDGRVRALVVDDDAESLGELEGALRRQGAIVLSARDGSEGLQVLLERLLSLDVLVVDLDLPGWDARRLAHLIRRAGGERDLGIVVLAPGEDPALREELLALGVDQVVDRRCGPEAVARAVVDGFHSRTFGGPPSSPAQPAVRAAGARRLTPRWMPVLEDEPFLLTAPSPA